MARIRTIKPEFPQSETVGKLSRDARLLFIMLWTIADDEGRLRASSRMLASLLYPYDDDARGLIDGWIDELERGQFVERYCVDGATYLVIPNWLKHQKIDKPSKSRLPKKDENSRTLANPREPSATDLGPVPSTKDHSIPAVASAPAATLAIDLGANSSPAMAKAIALATSPKDFDEFWCSYPKRDGANPKSPARKRFVAALRAGVSAKDLVASAKSYGDELRRTGKFGTQYVARASTWLSEERWNDYRPPPDDPERRNEQERFMLDRGYQWDGEKWKHKSEAA